MNSEKPSFAESVTAKLIEQLRQGTAPWQKPWMPGEAGSILPLNPTTGNRYKGINALQLMSEGHDDPRWMTYNQAQAADAQVRKGETGTRIQYWKFTEEQTKRDADGRPMLDQRGTALTDTVKLERPRVFFATVFNAEQIDGLPPLEQKQPKWNPTERAEEMLKASGAEIHHDEHDRAFYRMSTDSIHLPEKSQFSTADNYYATALHELGHWTGHESRLGRDLAHPFGSEAYAKEELRAEIASMILGDEIGIGHDPQQHAAYVESWIKVLRDDPTEILRAASDAEKIQNYVLSLENKLVHDEAEQLGQQYATRAADANAQDTLEADMGALYEIADDSIASLAAETWVIDNAQQGTLPRMLDRANSRQAASIGVVLASMTPVDSENPFWERHPLPLDSAALEERVATAHPLAAQRVSDSPVAEARKTMLSGGPDADSGTRADDFSRASEAALGFALPSDWNGRARVQAYGTETVDGESVFTTLLPKGASPDGWGVFVQHIDGGFAMMASLPSENEADRLAERLALIDAHSMANEHEKAAKLARINEERVRRDPDRTDEDISAARELRKNSEFIATKNDEDLQRRITQEESRIAHQSQSATVVDRLIDVPYKQKDEAKALGAKWDRQEQSWYIPQGVDQAAFSKWMRDEFTPIDTLPLHANADAGSHSRQYLAVPYSEHAQAKAAGAEWDRAAKSWYAGPNADLGQLAKWLPERASALQPPAMSPKEEFADALRSIGCVVGGEHPIMDGTKQRIPVEGENSTRKSGSGFYVAHVDGRPAGYAKNNKTGAEITWKAKGYVLEPQQKALLAADAATKLQLRNASIGKRQQQAAERVARQVKKLTPVTRPTPYLQAKGIEPHEGALTDAEGKKTYLPATDADGKQWSMQYIGEDGSKRFAREGRKEGCFHAVGGAAQLDQAPAIVISEGYATAATLKQALGFATVAAFDAGNLAPVAVALHQKFPNKPIVIAGDDDRHLEASQGINPGRSKAEEAAALVDGKVLLPIFGPGENNYPAGLELVTAKALRDHQKGKNTLNDEQLAAIARMKQFTDFNDLATKSALGMDAVERQVRPQVNDAVEKLKLAREETHVISPEQNDQQNSALEEQPKRRRAAKVAYPPAVA